MLQTCSDIRHDTWPACQSALAKLAGFRPRPQDARIHVSARPMHAAVPCVPRAAVWARSSRTCVHRTAPWQRFACIEIRLFDFCIFRLCLSFNLRGTDNLIAHAARRAAAAASCPAGPAAGCLGGSVMEALGPCAPSRASGPAARASFAFRRIDWRVMKGATIMHRVFRSRPTACATELEFRWCWWRTRVGTCPRHCIDFEVCSSWLGC